MCKKLLKSLKHKYDSYNYNPFSHLPFFLLYFILWKIQASQLNYKIAWAFYCRVVTFKLVVFVFTCLEDTQLWHTSTELRSGNDFWTKFWLLCLKIWHSATDHKNKYRQEKYNFSQFVTYELMWEYKIQKRTSS